MNKNGFGLTPEERSAAARKGGLKVSRNLEHMREIGRIGGKKSGESRRKKKNNGAEEV